MRQVLPLLLCCLALPSFAQEIDLTGGNEAQAPENADEQTHHEKTLAQVREAIDNSDLGPIRKRILQRKLNRPTVAVKVTDYVTSNAIDAGVVKIPPPPAWIIQGDEAGPLDATAEIDLGGLLDFIERLLPLIIQLIGLFGLTVSGSYWGLKL